jgi:hypothetical protein
MFEIDNHNNPNSNDVKVSDICVSNQALKKTPEDDKISHTHTHKHTHTHTYTHPYTHTQIRL